MGRVSGRTIALLTLAAALPVIEESVLVGIGFQAARGLASQVTAVWPYDSYHDLRWLLVYHNSWLGFALEFLVVIMARGLLSMALITLAWPAHVPRPSWRWLAVRNVEVAVLATVAISPWAAMSVAFSAVALSWYLLASVIPMLVLSPFLQRAGSVREWWRGLPSVELVGWSLLNFVSITLAGALTQSTTGWWGVPVAGAAGVVNGLLWKQTLRAALLPQRVRWARVPVAPLAVVLTLIAPAAAQATVGTEPPGQWSAPITNRKLPQSVRHAVIAIAGHDSSYDGRPAVDPLVEHFSYRGLDAQNRPLPYRAAATHRSLDSSVALLAAHVEALHRRTGRPVALAGVSEGAMLARTYLQKHPRSPVDLVVLFSPLVQAGRVYYPPPQARSGWGLVAGWELRAIFALANLARETRDYPDEPFVRSLLDNAPFYRNHTLCPVPGVRMVAFLPTITAIEAPPGEYSRVPVFEVPAFHGGVLGRPISQSRLIGVLSGEQINEPRREYRLLQRLAAAWQTPPLALSVNPVWRSAGQPDPAFTGQICPTS